MNRKKIEINYLEYSSLNDCPEDTRQLIQASLDAADHAYAPYSNFHVGAAVRLDDGSIITGNNQENMAYPSGLCAERVALFTASSQHYTKEIKAIAISSPMETEIFSPCGSCRQVMAEMYEKMGKPFEIILYTPNTAIRVFEGIADLLPFGFKNTSLRK